MVASNRDTARIRALNDQMRMGGIEASTDASQWVLTSGVMAMGCAIVREAVRQVREFNAFDAANDSHGEHDFGAFELAGERLFWKIDYYDRSMTTGSPNPSDHGATCRVLTIMLASEY